MTTVRLFAASGAAGMAGLFGSASGFIPVDTGMNLCALCPLLFAAGSLSALWAARR